MPLKIQFVSDIHVEFWEDKNKLDFLKPSAPILALLGDICCISTDADFELYKKFILHYYDKFERILIVCGNHEYYFNPNNCKKPATKHTMKACEHKLQKFCKAYEKLVYLNNRTMSIDTRQGERYLLIGSVLWTNIPVNLHNVVYHRMNDYSYIYCQNGKKIQRLTPDVITKIHMKNVAYIKRKIAKAKKEKRKVVIFTHHKPYLGDKCRGIQQAYETDLTSLMKNPVVLWCYGHTHKRDNALINGVQIRSNPKGYPYEKTYFNPKEVVVI